MTLTRVRIRAHGRQRELSVPSAQAAGRVRALRAAAAGSRKRVMLAVPLGTNYISHRLVTWVSHQEGDLLVLISGVSAELPPAFCDALAGRQAGRSLVAIVAVKSLLAPWPN